MKGLKMSITRLPSNLRPTTRECVHLATRGHFRSGDKDDSYTIRSAIVENPMLHANFMALCFIEPMEVLHCGNRNFVHFWFLWPWPWPDDLRIWTRPVVRGDMSHMCKCELPTWRLSKVIVWQTYIQTDTTNIPHRFTGGQLSFVKFTVYSVL